MCMYCDNLKTGNDIIPFLEKEVSFGILGTGFVSAFVTKDMQTGEPQIGTYIETESSTKNVASIQIQYCPFCGETLKDGA